MNAMDEPTLRSRVRGCLLGGAIGDALGAPIEFMSLDDIRERHGAQGLTDMVPAYGRLGAITDDTQMTLFTVEGLLRALVRQHAEGVTSVADVTHHAYLRWLLTQGEPEPLRRFGADDPEGFLVGCDFLHHRRASGNTCLSALRSGERGTLEEPINDSKGCGGVMRAAPVGFFSDPASAFELGSEIAAITHGHPSGYLSAGFLAAVVSSILSGADLPSAVDVASTLLGACAGHEEVAGAVRRALDALDTDPPGAETVERLGAGWVAEEALAISLYCALATDDLASGVLLAVNHSGDSDSTGAITGNILGAAGGEEAVPSAWLEPLEGRDVIVELADDVTDYLEDGFPPGIDEYSFPKTPEEAAAHERYWTRYPGW